MMTKADIAVFIFALVLLPALYIQYWQNSTQGDAARIIVGGKEKLITSLSYDQTLQIEGNLGTSTIEIHDGKIRFSDSPCTNKQCIHSGWLDHGGDVAVCFPNRITVAVLGKEQRFDTINF
ncbi:MAG: NusG domain II-containing protein [Gammaproteobacteria bacterium]